MSNEPRIYNRERTVSSINDVGKTGQPCAKKCNWITTLHNTQKLTQNGLKNIRPETIKLLKENIGRKLSDIILGRDNLLTGSKSNKSQEWDYI